MASGGEDGAVRSLTTVAEWEAAVGSVPGAVVHFWAEFAPPTPADAQREQLVEALRRAHPSVGFFKVREGGRAWVGGVRVRRGRAARW